MVKKGNIMDKNVHEFISLNDIPCYNLKEGSRKYIAPNLRFSCIEYSDTLLKIIDIKNCSGFLIEKSNFSVFKCRKTYFMVTISLDTVNNLMRDIVLYANFDNLMLIKYALDTKSPIILNNTKALSLYGISNIYTDKLISYEINEMGDNHYKNISTNTELMNNLNTVGFHKLN
jgi:hypothetical protein